MINLKEIKINCLNKSVIDNNSKFINTIINIEYDVVIQNECIKINEEITEFKYEFSSYMFLKIPLGSYQNIDNIYCTEIEYVIKNSQLPEVSVQDYELLRRENKKAIKLVKEYLKTEEFKRRFIKEII